MNRLPETVVLMLNEDKFLRKDMYLFTHLLMISRWMDLSGLASAAATSGTGWPCRDPKTCIQTNFLDTGHIFRSHQVPASSAVGTGAAVRE